MTLKEQLKSTIPETALSSLSDHYNVIGEVAVLSLPEQLSAYRQVIAGTVISQSHGIRTVLNKISRLEGTSRIPHFEVLAGGNTVTVHKEHGFSYRLDVRRVFFNPRLASERRRVTGQISTGERVLVPFCGVGPYVIPAAAQGATVVAIEQNPEAYHWLEENVVLNDVEDRVIRIYGDAFDPSLLPGKVFDRAIIPTPYGLDTIFDLIAPRVRPGGMIHFYTFCNRHQADNRSEEFIRKGFDRIIQRRCGNVAPSVSRWVYDLKKRVFTGSATAEK
jgi:tRNA (guanine37-N1)-methyltransferase